MAKVQAVGSEKTEQVRIDWNGNKTFQVVDKFREKWVPFDKTDNPDILPRVFVRRFENRRSSKNFAKLRILDKFQFSCRTIRNFPGRCLRHHNKPRPTARHKLLCCVFSFLFREMEFLQLRSFLGARLVLTITIFILFASTWPKPFWGCSRGISLRWSPFVKVHETGLGFFACRRNNSSDYLDQALSKTFRVGDSFRMEISRILNSKTWSRDLEFKNLK